MGRTVLILCNPSAGSYSREFIERVSAAADRSGARTSVVPTESAAALRDRATEASGRYDVIAAYGGDGSVNLVSGALLGSPSSLAVLPGGTANVIAKELGMPTDPESLGTMLAKAESRPGRLGLANDTTFAMMVGAGFDGEAVRNVSLGLKRVLGRGAYGISAARALFRQRKTRVDLRIGGDSFSPAWAVVTKIRSYAGRWILAPDAGFWKDTFQVVMFEEGHPVALLRHITAVLSGRLGDHEGVRMVEAASVQIAGPGGLPIQLDGDPFEPPPLRVRMSEETVRWIVPPSS